jgi:hypothetical protein
LTADNFTGVDLALYRRVLSAVTVRQDKQLGPIEATVRKMDCVSAQEIARDVMTLYVNVVAKAMRAETDELVAPSHGRSREGVHGSAWA